ncbi:MAG: RdgB/HAM1 family non-canonical purine NTP pyrophosphatase [Myxococcota bacterium]|nr:RdgB/HAM1 family non-canonical purine NTP pyrophosphatase [bacterium]MDP6075923.1 RdgB/HAM1 family non-canonical purine NTP pyrophosphatase [Myxococcota bacterium]MDP6242311.1 RdgB/HAM1 family non-canonical purine NTP pyrophosphatase [Myxococcota bacterium]MDP7076432.1 RdgB/HAM1 family non-canonical purine NTP pyrophosphatase [Myxococcota bacterium]MDP7298019.1 RdgB/HAM1 family non-canonical purine NTP pyrophosphatase [Myxococcota bacterium]
MRGAVVIATGNPGKLREIREILAQRPIPLIGLDDAGSVKFPEEGDDYEANAVAKAQAAARQLDRPALADDSGLEVNGLGGGPGPHSARYGGAGLDSSDRVAHLLAELAAREGSDRCARFVCVAALATPDGETWTARGECEGSIVEAPEGDGGFGYDPVFRPRGDTRTLACWPAAEKNRISHRARAFRALSDAVERVSNAGTGAPSPGAQGACIWLVRHAESIWNAEGRWQGRADPPLSERGRVQAKELASALRGAQLSLLVTSDLARAAETAACVGEASGLTPRPVPALRELDAGRWSGLTRAEIAREDAEALAGFDTGDPEARAGGGECRREAAERARGALREIVAAAGAQRIGVVTHGGVARALVPGLRLGNAAFVVLDVAPLLVPAATA